MKDVKSFNEELEKAKKELEFLASNREAQEAYIERENELRDYIFDVEYSREKGKKEGEEIGEKRGKKIGEEIGEKRGKEIGRKENSMVIAKKLLKKGNSIEEIAEITELPKEEIERLKDNI